MGMALANTTAQQQQTNTVPLEQLEKKIKFEPGLEASKGAVVSLVERATAMMFDESLLKGKGMTPEDLKRLRSTFDRDGLRIEVVNDPLAAYEKATGKKVDRRVYPDADAFTYTETDPKTGKATGTVILMSKGVFEQSVSRDGTDLTGLAKTVAILTHELRHCQQPKYPPNGEIPRDMGVGAREREAYQHEYNHLENIYAAVSTMDVRDYRARYGTLDPKTGKRSLDGEEKVREEMNFERIPRSLKKKIDEFAAIERTEPAPAAAPAALPTAGVKITARGEGAEPLVVAESSPQVGVIKDALKAGVKVNTISRGDLAFQIEHPNGNIEEVALSQKARTPEQRTRALALAIEGVNAHAELQEKLKKEGYELLPFRVEHRVGQPMRSVTVVARNKAGREFNYGTFHIEPPKEHRDVLEHGTSDYGQYMAAQVLAKIKAAEAK